jgi:Zn finger protein HypA/HybF involved in hydrogenase expression
MHEMSIALEICRMTEAHVGREKLQNVVEIGLEVGEDAGVEVDNLEFCLEALLSIPPFVEAKASITRLGGDVLRMSYLEVDDGDTQD